MLPKIEETHAAPGESQHPHEGRGHGMAVRCQTRLQVYAGVGAASCSEKAVLLIKRKMPIEIVK